MHNDAQQLLLDTYESGEFAHLSRSEIVPDMGDSLFFALYAELEGCEGDGAQDLAIQRISVMLRQVSEIHRAMRRLRDEKECENAC